MKCPKLSRVIPRGVDDWDLVKTDCLKEECAWWAKLSNSCDVHRTMVALEVIAGALESIDNKIPSGGR